MVMGDWNLSDAYSEQKGDTLSLELGPSLYEYLLGIPSFTSEIQQVRKEIFRSLGIYLPSIRIRSSSSNAPNQYMIRLRGEQAGKGVLYPPLFFSEKEEGDSLHPVRRSHGVWEEEGEESCKDIVTSHLRQILNRRIESLVTYEMASRWLSQANNHSPELVKELNQQGMTIGILWSVMKLLLEERIPLHPFEELLETMLDFYLQHPHEGYTPPEWTRFHPSEIAKYISSRKKERRVREGKQFINVISFSK